MRLGELWRSFGMDYDEILPELLIGSNPRSIDDIEGLRQKFAITAVLNLQTDEDIRSLNLVWKTLEAHYTACGIELCRVPVRDFDSIDLGKKLPECVRALDRLLAAGHRVYIHCTAGAGRSPSVAVAYLHWCRGWDLVTSVAYVKERRSCSPDVDAICLADWGAVDEPATPPSPKPEHSS